MKHEIIICNHRAKRGTLQAKKYGTLIIFLSWLLSVGMLYSMTIKDTWKGTSIELQHHYIPAQDFQCSDSCFYLQTLEVLRQDP